MQSSCRVVSLDSDRCLYGKAHWRSLWSSGRLSVAAQTADAYETTLRPLRHTSRAAIAGLPADEDISSMTTAQLRLDCMSRDARLAFEHRYFEFHLANCAGNVTQVAASSGMGRTHLYRKLKALGIDPGVQSSIGDSERPSVRIKGTLHLPHGRGHAPTHGWSTAPVVAEHDVDGVSPRRSIVEVDAVGQESSSPFHDQWLLDEALAETFPASDPISPAVTHARPNRKSR